MASNLKIGLFGLLALSTALVGCPPPDDSGKDDTALEGCDNGVDETVPEANATDAYWRADVEFQLDDPDESSPSIVLLQGETEVTL